MRIITKIIRNRRGQALVELALTLPLLIMLVMGIIEFGRIFHSYILVTNASREGARIAITGADNTTIISRVNDVSGTLGSVTVVITPNDKALRKSNTSVEVNVKHNLSLITPLLDTIVPNPIQLSSATSMRME